MATEIHKSYVVKIGGLRIYENLKNFSNMCVLSVKKYASNRFASTPNR
jgi:hypothetical protein